jgi:nitroreductase
MAGIVFCGSRKLQEIKNFYANIIGCRVWLEQQDCIILQHDNFLLGFCNRENAENTGIITFFYNSPVSVDRIYSKLKESAEGSPVLNKKYNIYHFYAADPEGRRLEFQYFEHPIPPYISGEKLLVDRRSQRSYKTTGIPDEIIRNIIDNCRFAPSSHNSQPCYFKVIRNRDIIYRLSELRSSSSTPIARAPLAVAIVSDPAKTKRPIEDGCIMAYHFLLAARLYDLGTCWIAAMDREDVKELLGIPRSHYIATISPLGYPEDMEKAAPPRKPLSSFLPEI